MFWILYNINTNDYTFEEQLAFIYMVTEYSAMGWLDESDVKVLVSKAWKQF